MDFTDRRPLIQQLNELILDAQPGRDLSEHASDCGCLPCDSRRALILLRDACEAVVPNRLANVAIGIADQWEKDPIQADGFVIGCFAPFNLDQWQAFLQTATDAIRGEQERMKRR